jgi:hypothetical protein
MSAPGGSGYAEGERGLASSPTEVQPVFDTIVRSAAKLYDGVIGALNTFDGALTHVAAVYNCTPEALAVIQNWAIRNEMATRGEIEQIGVADALARLIALFRQSYKAALKAAKASGMRLGNPKLSEAQARGTASTKAKPLHKQRLTDWLAIEVVQTRCKPTMEPGDNHDHL